VSRSSIPQALREAVFRRDAGRCQYCRLAQLGHGATFHVDHIVPRSRGGSTSLNNLALQCPNCSLRKSNKTTAIDPQHGQPIALFHPLLQAWREHFRLLDDATCVGITPVGRATVEALQMNAMIPRFARACQLALGLLDAS
jgi:hypothetical protein